RERMRPRKPAPDAQRLGARDDLPLDRAYVGHDRSRIHLIVQLVEQPEVGGGGRGGPREIGGAGDIRRSRWRVVERALPRGGGALARLGGPTDNVGNARPLRLERDGPADRAEADDAEREGAHGMETSRHAGTRKRRGRPVPRATLATREDLQASERERFLARHCGARCTPKAGPQGRRQRPVDGWCTEGAPTRKAG